MITELHDVHVSRELAILLKKAGFDWACRGYFDNTGFHDGSVECTNYSSDTCKYLKAPTLEVAQRWLREVKNIDINVLTDFDSVKRLYYVRYVIKDGHYRTYYITKNQSYVYFNTYEEAQEAGIKEALEILLEKVK